MAKKKGDEKPKQKAAEGGANTGGANTGGGESNGGGPRAPYTSRMRKRFDGRGNFTLGVKDHLIFPEVDLNKLEVNKGMNITIATTAANDEQALFLLRELGMPFVQGR